MITMHIGFDDTDSPRMGCTTYIAALLVEKLCRIGVSFIDYPNLIRLNPNVPWKTRGNGALCLRLQCDNKIAGEIMEIVVTAVEESADLGYGGTEPGIVFLIGNHIPKEIRGFAKQTIQGIVKMKEAVRLIRMFGAQAVGFKTGRGIIGGLAAIGETLEDDYTFEIITYRAIENRGTKRRIQASSVLEMTEKTAPLTFNNIDPERGRILITPRGPDPILYGIRGETLNVLKQAYEIVRPEEPIERWVVFRTNHGTDAHLRRIGSISEIQPFHPVMVRGTVAKEPQIIPGGHVIFPIEDKTGRVDCAAYEPTGALREAAKCVIAGDLIEACGGVRPPSSKHPVTINLEKMRVLRLAPQMVFFNPNCPKCDKRMESMGKGQGFRCKRCGFRSTSLRKVAIKVERKIKRGLYIASPRSQRHLTKPLCRYGQEKSGQPKEMVQTWHFP
ncbi:MAG: tRNA(Ile2) 2-agmatinylcytidine synthetase TiaS [Candidatus Bathyarchaeota archaeon BA1]|nr:MAG: tRNA(Ile2) 2-agmatinylcytidine synthetase TiaS [Candidatus Bathyarchaeota archaeon BA1]